MILWLFYFKNQMCNVEAEAVEISTSEALFFEFIIFERSDVSIFICIGRSALRKYRTGPLRMLVAFISKQTPCLKGVFLQFPTRKSKTLPRFFGR